MILLVCLLLLIINNICYGRLRELREEVELLPLSRGIHIPIIGLGTAGLREDTSKIVLTALNAGIRLIDTAQAVEWYDEKQVGIGLQEYIKNNDGYTLDDFVIVTKVHPRFFEFKKMEKRLDQSIEYLHGENNDRALDVVLLHSPRCWNGHCNQEEESHTWQEAWRNLEQFKEEGKVLEIGISNFDYEELKDLLSMSNTKVAVIQNWMDPLHQDRATRELAQSNGIAYMAYSSYGTQWQGRRRKLNEPDNPVLHHPELLRIADKHGATVPQVINSWLSQLKVIAIPRSSSEDHVIENAQHREFLDDIDMFDIQALDNSIGTPWD
jgi:diketogulonate reductase-like aldo/keto reductase